MLTDEALQVPLLVRGPGIAPGTISDLPVTLVDLPATFAGLTDVLPGWLVDGTLAGADAARPDQPFRDTTLVQTGAPSVTGGPTAGVRTERYLYGINGSDGFLYDRREDPDELVNLYDDPALRGRAGCPRAAPGRSSSPAPGWTCNQVFGPLPEPLG